GRGRGRNRNRIDPRARFISAAGALIPLSKNHFSGRGLQHRGDRDVDSLAHHLSGVVHHHHGPVVEIGHALVVFLAFLQDEDPHGLAGQNDRLQRVGQFVDIQHRDALQLRHLVQVEVVGDDFAFIQLGQFDQLQVHFPDGREVILDDLYLERRDLLQALQYVEPATPPVALERVGGVGHQLQFAQHKLRSHDGTVEKTSLGDVGDAAVDDDAGIEDLIALLALLLPTEDATHRRQVQQVALVCSHHQADIGHQQHHQDLQEALGMPGSNAVANDQGEQVGAEDAEDAADGSANQALQADSPQAPLEQNNSEADERAHSCV